MTQALIYLSVFGTKIQRTNTLKVEYAIESKFLSDKWIWGVKLRVIYSRSLLDAKLQVFTLSTACRRRAEHVQ